MYWQNNEEKITEKQRNRGRGIVDWHRGVTNKRELETDLTRHLDNNNYAK